MCDSHVVENQLYKAVAPPVLRPRHSSGRVLVAVIAGMLLLSNLACDSNPVGPSPDRYRAPRLNMYCQVPVDATVQCRAVLFDVPRWGDSQDVTSSATWTVDPSSVATFAAPGLLRPMVQGEGTIHVRHGDWTAAVVPTFLLDPTHDARWLYWLQVKVVEDSGQAGIAGVTIEMLDGYQAGASCTTNGFGVCTIDRLLTRETFTGRASKAGYESVMFTYRVDPPVGLGNAPFYTIRLSRLSSL